MNESRTGLVDRAKRRVGPLRRRLLPPLAAVLALALPAPALGADPTPAAALFQEGREAAKAGDYATACAKLDKSYRLDAALGTLLNLADCQEHLGKTTTAWQLFQRAVEQLPRGDDRIGPARKRVIALERRVARIEVTLPPGAPPGIKVTRDGADLETLGAPVPIDPGRHVLVVSAPGRADRRLHIAVFEGETSRVVAHPGDPGSQPPPPSSGGLGAMRIAGIAVGSAGIVAMAAALGTGLSLPAKQSTIQQHCGPPLHPANLCDATGFDAAQSGKQLAAANTALWAIGLAATGTGVVLVVVGGLRKNEETAFQVAPVPGGAAAAVRGRF